MLFLWNEVLTKVLICSLLCDTDSISIPEQVFCQKSLFMIYAVHGFYLCAFSIAYTALTDHESARECYRKALELDPTNQSYQNNLEIAEQKLKEAAMQVK